jgi:hypothetical protein
VAINPLPKSLQDIECIVAPDRDSANQLIATLHTSNPRKPWGPLRQAEFFAAQIAAGKTAQELIDEYPGVDVASFIETAEMHRLLITAEYEDEEVARYARRKNFPISTFERLYSNPDFLAMAHLEVDKATGHVTYNGDRDGLNRLAEKLVHDIKSKRINTRVLNKPNEQSYKRYMDELTAINIAKAPEGQAVSEMPEPPNLPTRARTPSSLDVTGLYAPPAFPAIGRILDELGSIRYRDFPNATFDLIRSFLEKSVKAYAEAKRVDIPRKCKYVFLDTALEWLLTDVEGAPGKKSLVQVIKKLRQNDKFSPYSYYATADYLNAANHNHQIFIEKTDVENLWSTILPLLRYVLREDVS